MSSHAASFSSLLMSFGGSIGINNIKLDEQSRCAFLVDNKTNVQINFDSEKNAFYFLTEIGEVAKVYEERFCECLLKANADYELTCGMTLARMPDSGKIFIESRVPVYNLDLNTFKSRFNLFISKVKQWEIYIAQMCKGELPEELSDI